jgi:ABC-type lipoprotein release transport system permease subunit
VDVLALALRYIVSRKVAIVSLFFIMVGVMANIVVQAVMDGFQERIQTHLRGTESDLNIWMLGGLPADHFARVKQELADEMTSRGGPIEAVAPHHFTLGIVGNQQVRPGFWPEDQQQAVRIVGIDIDLEKKVVPLEKMLTDLRPEDQHLRLSEEDLADPFRERSVPGVILGSSLAKALKVKPGDKLQLLTGELKTTDDGQTEFKPNNLGFELLGCFDSGREDYDMTFVYLSRPDFERLKWGESTVLHQDCRTVQAKVTDSTKVAQLKEALKARHPGLGIGTWEEKNETLLEAVKSEKSMIVIILFFIIGIAAGSILGILYMMVIEKTRDIGILRSMGLSSRRVVAVFVSCGAVLGALGASAGLALGLTVVRNINAIKAWLAGWPFYFEVFNPKVYRFKDIPVKIVPEWILGTVLAAFALAVLAGVIPAVTAARLDPVRCLKDD